MHFLLWAVAIGAFLAAWSLWDLAMVAALRVFSIRLPISFAFLFWTRRERELHAALKEISKIKYVIISGFLLFACPLFAGFTAYDFFIDRYFRPSIHDVWTFMANILVWAIVGIGFGLSEWKKSVKKEVGTTN